MCYHRYTKHSCGHQSTTIGRCDPNILSTRVPFCDHYQVLKSSSFWLCHGSYCNEDKDTAHWVENGQSLLTACDDDFGDLKSKILDRLQKLQAADDYRKAFGVLSDEQKVQDLQKEYEQLTGSLQDMKNRRRLIVNNIEVAKQKQKASAERCTQMIKQAQAIQAAKMAKTHQPGTSQLSLPSPIFQPSINPRIGGVFAGRTLDRTNSSIWEGEDKSETPSRLPPAGAWHLESDPTNQTIPRKVVNKPLLPAPFLSPTVKQARSKISEPSPPKKRRGRPPKAKREAPVPSPQVAPVSRDQDSPINAAESPASNDQEPPIKRRATKRAVKKQIAAPKSPSPGRRRSGRIKQRISYAESPNSSPERLFAEEEPHLESPDVIQSIGSSRSARTTNRNKQVQNEEDDIYHSEDGDEDAGDSEATDDMYVDYTPVEATRRSSKRIAGTPRNPRPLERQAIETHDSHSIGTSFDYVDQDLDVDGFEISPIRQSDMMNYLGEGSVSIPSIDDLNDPNDYDFDVGAMSRMVAGLDAQQG